MPNPSNRFTAFPDATLTFLRAIRQNNTKKWFDAHRSEYEQFYLAPAKDFVDTVGFKLRKLAPKIVAEPRINGSIFRINKDIRFSKDKRPYKDHLDFAFWEGDKKSSASTLFLRVSPDGTYIGAGHHACPHLLKAFRLATSDPVAGKSLAATAKKLRKAGYRLEGAHYKRMPRGFPEDGPAAEFLLHNGLYVVTEDKPQAATAQGLIDKCLKHWKAALPLHRWLIEHVRA